MHACALRVCAFAASVYLRVRQLVLFLPPHQSSSSQVTLSTPTNGVKFGFAQVSRISKKGGHIYANWFYSKADLAELGVCVPENMAHNDYALSTHEERIYLKAIQNQMHTAPIHTPFLFLYNNYTLIDKSRQNTLYITPELSVPVPDFVMTADADEDDHMTEEQSAEQDAMIEEDRIRHMMTPVESFKEIITTMIVDSLPDGVSPKHVNVALASLQDIVAHLPRDWLACVTDVRAPIKTGHEYMTMLDHILSQAPALDDKELLVFILALLFHGCTGLTSMNASTYRGVLALCMAPHEYSVLLKARVTNGMSCCYDAAFSGLQPTCTELALLEGIHAIVKPVWTPREWYQHLTEPGIREYDQPISAALFRSRTLEEVQNLQIRCHLLVEELRWKKNKTRLILMDGHGRSLYYLLHYLYEMPLHTPIEIVVVECDDVVQRWHDTFFPVHESVGAQVTVRLVHDDMFAFLRQQDEAAMAASVVYLNFCGIGDSFDDLTHTLHTATLAHDSIFLSASYDRGSRKRIDELLGAGLHTLVPYAHAVEVAAFPSTGKFRTDFKTWRLRKAK
jgi:hypothetical protein